METTIKSYLQGHRQTLDRVEDQLLPDIEKSAHAIVSTLREGGKVMVMGNGGSAADAQHFAAELVGRFLTTRRGLPAIALTTDSSILTAVGNDFGFDQVFSRQVEALAHADDLVVGISTSGNSENVLRGLAVAKEHGCTTLALLGRDGGMIRDKVDVAVIVPSEFTPHIQECHAMIIHLWCQLVDQAFEHEAPEGCQP